MRQPLIYHRSPSKWSSRDDDVNPEQICITFQRGGLPPHCDANLRAELDGGVWRIWKLVALDADLAEGRYGDVLFEKLRDVVMDRGLASVIELALTEREQAFIPFIERHGFRAGQTAGAPWLLDVLGGAPKPLSWRGREEEYESRKEAVREARKREVYEADAEAEHHRALRHAGYDDFLPRSKR
jgi:hypothetical protein